MPRDGIHYIWARGRSIGAGDNSFHFSLNDDNILNVLIWDVPDELSDGLPEDFCPEWCWDLIANRPGEEPFKFDFKQGKNDLYIVARESNTGLDALYIVPDPAMAPPEEPLEEGILDLAVEPIHKLSETWGRIKEVNLVDH